MSRRGVLGIWYALCACVCAAPRGEAAASAVPFANFTWPAMNCGKDDVAVKSVDVSCDDWDVGQDTIDLPNDPGQKPCVLAQEVTASGVRLVPPPGGGAGSAPTADFRACMRMALVTLARRNYTRCCLTAAPASEGPCGAGYCAAVGEPEPSADGPPGGPSARAGVSLQSDFLESVSGPTAIVAALASGHGGYLRLVLAAVECRPVEDAGGAWSFILHPTGLRVLGRADAGAIVGNIAVVGGASIAVPFGALLISSLSGCLLCPSSLTKVFNDLDDVGVLSFPSVPYVFYQVMYAGTAFAVMRLLQDQGGGAAGMAVALLGVAFCVIPPLVLSRIVRRGVPSRAYLQESLEETTTCTALLIGSHEWVSRSSDDHFARGYRSFLSRFRQQCAAYAAAEHALVLVLAGLAAFAPRNGCVAAKAGGAGVAFLAAALEVTVQPHLLVRHRVVEMLFWLLIAAGAGLAAAVDSKGDQMTTSDALYTAAWALAVLGAALDALAFISVVVGRRRWRLQEEAFDEQDRSMYSGPVTLSPQSARASPSIILSDHSESRNVSVLQTAELVGMSPSFRSQGDGVGCGGKSVCVGPNPVLHVQRVLSCSSFETAGAVRELQDPMIFSCTSTTVSRKHQSSKKGVADGMPLVSSLRKSRKFKSRVQLADAAEEMKCAQVVSSGDESDPLSVSGGPACRSPEATPPADVEEKKPVQQRKRGDTFKTALAAFTFPVDDDGGDGDGSDAGASNAASDPAPQAPAQTSMRRLTSHGLSRPLSPRDPVMPSAQALSSTRSVARPQLPKPLSAASLGIGSGMVSTSLPPALQEKLKTPAGAADGSPPRRRLPNVKSVALLPRSVDDEERPTSPAPLPMAISAGQLRRPSCALTSLRRINHPLEGTPSPTTSWKERRSPPRTLSQSMGPGKGSVVSLNNI